MLERPPIDWSRPVQWMNGDPIDHVEWATEGTVIWLTDRCPAEIEPLMQRKHFKRHILVYSDTGVPMTSLGEYAPEAWVENVNPIEHPMAHLVGTF
jgi:hypothetical protein